MFCGAWTTQINELSVLVKDINELCQGKRAKQVYLSLPRPGKHGTTAKGVKPDKLSSQVGHYIPNSHFNSYSQIHVKSIPK